MHNVIWAEPKNVTSIDDCYFYHTMDIPDHGIVHGEWDLRGREAAYLGNVNLAGKRVLEVGTASGHLCFTMEKMGASVVAYDLSDEQQWDVVPYAEYNMKQYIADFKSRIRRLNNGYWFAHRAFNSSAKVVYGSVYEIPDNIGTFDVCTFGSILLHLRDPFLALQRVSAHVQEKVIVTDTASGFGLRALAYKMLTVVEALTGVRLIRFLPNAKKLSPLDSWWTLTPRLVSEFLQILGFAHTTISFHRQLHENKEILLFTVVGQRKKASTY
ncbi:MAG: methyltransferase domain-containing protein [Candidatus Aminicenantes bacterium]|nr:methyltransferase domain-containing protein [Candidatus Aminicenantes bacterium]